LPTSDAIWTPSGDSRVDAHPPTISLDWAAQYRIISSRFPPISIFESVVDDADFEIAFYIEGLTNPRLREEVGEIERVPAQDRLFGPGASVVMAAFTHIGRPSRFSDGRFGVYYASRAESTAIAETAFHRERFLRATDEEDCELTMRVYKGEVQQPLHDVRASEYAVLHDPDPSNYAVSQKFAARLRGRQSWGIVYNSVRQPDGECIAALRPPAVSKPVQTKHLRYVWRQRAGVITDVLHVRGIDYP